MNLSTQKPIANPNPTEAFKSFALCDTAQEQAASLGLLVPSKIPAGTVLSIAGNTYTINGGVGVCSGGQTTGPLGILPWFPCSIGSNAFGYCSGLTGSLVIPNSVTSVGNGAFQGCSLLTTVYADVDASVVASTAFSNSGVTIIYYHSTMSGWTPSPWNHIPTAEWTSYPDPMP